MGLAHTLDILSSKRARPIESMGRSSNRFRTCAIEKTVQTPESRRHGVSSSEGMTGRMRVDRGRGRNLFTVHKADKEGIDELRGRKWAGGSY